MMKKLLAILCALVLLVSLSATAFAADDDLTLEEVYTAAMEAQKMAQKALDEQAIQNVMSRHILYHNYGEHAEEMEELWVQEPANQATATFGMNMGYEVGYDYIWEFYVDLHDSGWLKSAKQWCEDNGVDISGMTDEEVLETYGGVGQMLLHVITTAIIEVADDGLTAKGYWYTPGMLMQTGDSAAQTMWENYGADFIKEDGEWKIWHLHMYTDFQCEFGDTFTNTGTSAASIEMSGTPISPSVGASSEEPASAAAAETNANPGGAINGTTYQTWTPNRLRQEMEIIPIPLPYESWDFSEPNYGVTIEQYASLGVDVNDWYEAHGIS